MTHPTPNVWWKHRRRHSYIALAGLFCLIPIGLFLDADQLGAAVPLFQTLAWVFGAVILTYVVAATADDLVDIRVGRDD